MPKHDHKTSLLKGAAAGIAGGLVATTVMTIFQTAVNKAEAEWGQESPQMDTQATMGQSPRRSHSQMDHPEAAKRVPQPDRAPTQQADADEPSTVKAAQAVSEKVFGHKLSKKEKKIAGPAMHYAIGLAWGTAYGVASEYLCQATIGKGSVFGAAVWAADDEVILPLLGLSKPPQKQPASTHVYAAASHVVYGVACELTRCCVRKMLR